MAYVPEYIRRQREQGRPVKKLPRALGVIPRAMIDAYTAEINAASGNGRELLRADLERLDLSDPDAVVDDVVRIMTNYAHDYAYQSAAISAKYYDAFRVVQLGEPSRPPADPMWNKQASEQAARGILYKYKTAQSRLDMLVGRLDYEVKEGAAGAMSYAGYMDKTKPKFARVPAGNETCRFCLFFASRGFVYNSARSAGEGRTGIGDHWHPNCDCRIVPSWPVSNAHRDNKIHGRKRPRVRPPRVARNEQEGEREAPPRAHRQRREDRPGHLPRRTR